jgi:hypothetical protein
MSSRALSLATVLLLIGFAAVDAQAQNLEAGKTPSQIFSQTCSACHKSPRGLLKTVAPGSLPGFLRQHYTTSSDMAGVLASYLISNGAADTRYGGAQPKGAKEKEANSSPTTQAPDHLDRFGRRSRPQEAAKPEAEGAAAPPSEAGRAGQKRTARPGEDGAKDGARPATEGQATSERAADGRKRLSKRGKPEATEEAPKAETAKDAPAVAAPASDEKKGEAKSEAAKVDSGRDEAKPDGVKPGEKPAADQPSGDAKTDSPKTDSPKTDASKTDAPKPEQSAKAAEPTTGETPALRPDPVPQVTPASPAAAKPAEPPASGTAGSEPAAAKPQEPSTPPAVTAVAPPPPPAPPPSIVPAGPPTPPISQ